MLKTNVKSKPIQPTPVLTGQDAALIIKQALRTPTQKAIAKNEEILKIRRKITKNELS